MCTDPASSTVAALWPGLIDFLGRNDPGGTGDCPRERIFARWPAGRSSSPGDLAAQLRLLLPRGEPADALLAVHPPGRAGELAFIVEIEALGYFIGKPARTWPSRSPTTASDRDRMVVLIVIVSVVSGPDSTTGSGPASDGPRRFGDNLPVADSHGSSSSAWTWTGLRRLLPFMRG